MSKEPTRIGSRDDTSFVIDTYHRLRFPVQPPRDPLIGEKKYRKLTVPPDSWAVTRVVAVLRQRGFQKRKHALQTFREWHSKPAIWRLVGVPAYHQLQTIIHW